MAEEITWKELSKLIRRQMFEPDVTTMIHICDNGKEEEIFDIDVYPYNDEKIRTFYMKKEKDAYSNLYIRIKRISPERLSMSISKDVDNGKYTLKITLNRNVRIFINYYTDEGKKWLDNIYNGRSN